MAEPRTYYGEMEGALHGDNASAYAVDAMYQRILDKHDEKLKKTQIRMVEDLRKTFKDDVKKFNKEIRQLTDRIAEMDRKINGLIEKKGK